MGGPDLDLEQFFLGDTQAWGLVEDRFGRLRRQFTAVMTGSRDGADLLLAETFRYADGAREERTWRIRKLGGGHYRGAANDVIGAAEGLVEGDAATWRYRMDLPIGGRRWRVDFDDRMYLRGDRVMLNRVVIRKWGIVLARVSIAFVKPARAEAATAAAFAA